MIKICLNCKKEFEGNSKRKFCSRKCSSEFQKGENNPNYKGANINVNCSCCGKEFNILKCTMKNSDGSLKKNFYCSKECKIKHQKEILKGENNPNYKGGKIKIKCDFCGKVFYRERNRYTVDNKHYYCSQKCKSEHQRTILLGKNNPSYINGLSHDYRVRFRIIEGYKTWREEVYKRDNYTCQCCGNNKGHNLNAHHLESYNKNKNKRTELENGITLCDKCHKKFHKMFGYGNNTKEQFKQFKDLYINPVTNK